ncbi:MAG TPA: adenylyltransferase/cytidyltransferase family protein [Nevskiaceae bacterium]|nr:adenylyltransferase/cytidyltransferase family protein [Nevskiaceae bacterium]
MSRIGIYPGTFDPIHQGHIAFALAAAKQAKLERVVLLPETQPRKKTGVTDIAHRVAMLQHAVQSFSHLQVMTLQSRQFTVGQTLPELRQHLPTAELVLLMGSDVAKTLGHHWQGLGELLRTVPLVIGMRQDDTLSAIQSQLNKLVADYKVPLDVMIIPSTYSTLSSSHIRTLPQVPAVSDNVLGYISRHRLYGFGASQ